MSFFKGRSQKDIAAHPLPASSAASDDMPAASSAPDFAAVLSRLRRSFLDDPIAPGALKAAVGPALTFLRLARVPRRLDDQGRPMLAVADRERLVLTALHGLGQPIALRVENRAGELHVALGIAALEAADTLGRSMTCHFPGSQFAALDPTAAPAGCAAALLVGTPQPPPEGQELHPTADIGSLATALRGREWGLTVSARPIARPDTVRVVETIAADAREWSVYIREGIDASSQKGQTVTRATRRERVDRQAQLAVEWLELVLARTTAGESEGLWEWSGILWGRDADTLNVAAALTLGLFGGPKGLPEPLRVVRLPKTLDVQAAIEGRTTMMVGDTALVTRLPSSHLASLVKFPRESVPGFSAVPSAAFSTATAVGTAVRSVTVGAVLDRGAPTGHNLTIPISELASHTLVAGMTGAGKTNTCMALLRACTENGVPFLVIEPAKTEYRSLLRDSGLGSALHIFTLGDETTSPFRLNPFICPEGFPVATHLDYLKSVFTSSFSMYGPMPHILEEAMLKVYEKRGWDLARNTNRREGGVERHLLFPTLGDLLDEIDPVVRAIGYAQELTMDIRGALKTRIKSLLAGAKGLMLGGIRSTPLETLLAHPTVLELAALGDDQEKSLLMGLLLIGIYEHRQAQGTVSGRLVHVTLIEEAHRILKNVSTTTTNPEVANVAGKAVDTFNNILSEARAYGEGLIIAEQIPTKLSPDAMKNTGLKLIHRLQAVDDRTAVGDTMVLSPAQKQELARLPALSAVAFGAGLAEAVLVGVAANKPEFAPGFVPVSNREVADGARAFHVDHRGALERFPACVSCPAKCQRPQEAAELLDDPDSTRYRAFSRLLLAWTLGARPDEAAVASLAAKAHNVDAYCAGAHLVHRYFRERADFYRLTPTDRATIERDLALAAGGGWGSLAAREFRQVWLPYLERKAAHQQAICRDCRHPFCYGYEMDRALGNVELLDQFSRVDTDEECQAFLAAVSADVLGARVPTLQERLGYCFFIRRYSEVRVEQPDGRYNRLMETFT